MMWYLPGLLGLIEKPIQKKVKSREVIIWKKFDSELFTFHGNESVSIELLNLPI